MPDDSPDRDRDVSPLYQEWSLRDATLFTAGDDARAAKGAYYGDTVEDLRAVFEHATSVVDVDADDHRGQVVPLHEPDSPRPTGEYVLWNSSSGTVGWRDESFGVSPTTRFVDLADVRATVVAWRVRFWHPDCAPGGDDFADATLPGPTVAADDPLAGRKRRDLFASLRNFVEEERTAERDAAWADHVDADLDSLVAAGAVEGPFAVVATETEYGADRPAELRLQHATDDHGDVDLVADCGLYPDNHVVLDAPDDAFPIPARVVDVDGPVLTLQPTWERVDDEAGVVDALDADESTFWVGELLNPVPFDRRLDAVAAVRETPAKRDLLTGQRPLSFSTSPPSRRRTDLELDEYQRAALAHAVAADDVACIHGPPGTGKTRTLTAFVAHAVARGQRVLVTAHSNQAVDNLLVGDSTPADPEAGTLHGIAASDDGPALSMARVGHNSRNRVVEQEYRQASVERADVVAATTSGAAAFDQDEFDVAVVDEATQASRPATAIALNAAEKLVLAGDHRQLPPYCADEQMQAEAMHRSLFEALVERYGDEIAVLLGRQYRMHETIARFPNRAFYGGDLETAARNRDWTISGFAPVALYDVAGDEHRESKGASVRNPREAGVVVDRVADLLDADVAPEDVGVVAAYSGQVREIRRRLGERDLATRAVTVDTVDSFQGGEREAVVVSFTRSNDDANSGFLAFPSEGPRRLNVALTRARKHLALVGDWATLGTRAPHRDPDESCADTYAALYDSLVEADAARLVEGSPLRTRNS